MRTEPELASENRERSCPTPGCLPSRRAFSGFGRPDKHRRPARQASRIAWAINSGSRAPAIPVLSSTPSQPNSMAMLTSLAVPTPASTITG